MLFDRSVRNKALLPLLYKYLAVKKQWQCNQKD